MYINKLIFYWMISIYFIYKKKVSFYLKKNIWFTFDLEKMLQNILFIRK